MENVVATLNQCYNHVTLAQRPGSTVSQAFLMDVIWSILSVSFSASMLSASLSSVTTRSVQCGLVRSRTCASRDHKAHTKYIMHTRTHNNVPAEGHCTAMYYDYVSFNQKLRQSGTQPASHPGLYYTFCSAFLSLL